MKKKQSNKVYIIVAVMITVIAVGIMVAVSIINSGNKDTNKTDAKFSEVSDTIIQLAASSDLEVMYINSSKRNVVFFIGSEGYYGLYYSDAGKLFIKEGTYTVAATTDEKKLVEAEQGINVTSGYTVFSENVTEFSVDNANYKTGMFDDGVMKVTLTVKDGEGNTKRDTISAKIPVKETPSDETPAE